MARFEWILIVLNVIIIDVICYHYHPHTDIGCCEEYCLANDTNPYLYFSTKTAYQYIHGSYFMSKEEEGEKIIRETSHKTASRVCEPLQYWSIIRHGTRLPSKKNIISFQTTLPILQKEIISNYEKNKNPPIGSLCRRDYENIKNWKFNKDILPEQGYYLTEQGKKDLKYLGRRTGNFLAPLFYPTGDFNPDNYVLKYTKTERVLKSYESFIEGAFGDDAKKINGIIIAENDTIIQNYVECDAFNENKKFVKNDPQSEPNRFQQSQVFQQLLKDVAIRLGFNTRQMKPKIIQLIYDACRYEKAWYFNRYAASPWCAVFTPKQLEVLEYWQDLLEYYIDGYGNTLSANLGCFAVQNLFLNFNRVIKDRQRSQENYPKVVTSFGHSTIINMLLTTLGIAEDSFPITAANFDTNKTKSRLWRTSKLTPFAANLGAVLYQCSDNIEGEPNYEIEFYLNENVIRNYGSTDGTWKWIDFYQKFKSLINECSLNVCIVQKDYNTLQV